MAKRSYHLHQAANAEPMSLSGSRARVPVKPLIKVQKQIKESESFGYSKMFISCSGVWNPLFTGNQGNAQRDAADCR